MKAILIITLVSTINGQSMTDTIRYPTMEKCKEAERLALTQQEILKKEFQNFIDETECIEIE